MRTITIIILVLIGFVTLAQDSTLKWGKIPENDLLMQQYDADPEAEAVVLQKYMRIYFDVWQNELRMMNEYKFRIKILKQNGIKYATIEIPITGNAQFEEISYIKGKTYNTNQGTKPTLSKLKGKQIQYIKNKGELISVKFTLPDVKVGSVIEYSYTIASLQMVKPRTWNFQLDIPVRFSVAEIQSPDFMIYRMLINSDEYIRYQKNEDILQSIFIHRIPFGNQSRSYTLKINTNYSTISMENIPAFKAIPFLLNPEMYRVKLKLNLVELSKRNTFYSLRDIYVWEYLTRRLFQATEENYEIANKFESDARAYPAGYYIYKVKDWDVFAKRIWKSPNFGKILMKRIPIKPELDKIVENQEGKNKMIAIYDFVRKNIKWNQQYKLYPSDELTEIYKRRTGTSSEINMLLINLLRSCDFQCFPVLISTIDNGIIDKGLASDAQFNHVIACVELDEKKYLLDATDSIRAYTILDKKTLNDEGFVIKPEKPYWIPLKDNEKSYIQYHDSIRVTSDWKIKRNMKVFLIGHYAYEISTKKNQPINDSAIISTICRNNTHTDNFTYQFSTENIHTQKIVIQANYNETDIFDKTNLAIYPFKNYPDFDNPFNETTRNYPVQLGFPIEKVIRTTILLPENIEVYDLPQPVNISFGGNIGTFLYEIDNDTNSLNINILIKITETNIEPYNYQTLKTFFSNIETKAKEPIFLKKN